MEGVGWEALAHQEGRWQGTWCPAGEEDRPPCGVLESEWEREAGKVG